jgi:hypothetical protein
LKLRFAVKPSLPSGTQAGVRLEYLLFNEGLPAVETHNGIVTMAGVPDASALSSPGDGWTGQPVTLSLWWNGVAYAETYHLQIATDAAFTTLVVNDSTLTTTSTSVGPLANGTVHYWRVRAKNSVGAGPWTSAWSFRTVASVAAAPILASPLDEAIDLTITPMLRWHSSFQATSYDIQVAEDSTFVSDVRFVGGVADTTYELGALDHSRRYHWRVRAVNEAGPGTWSPSWAFRTVVAVAGTPLLAEPGSGTIMVSIAPTFHWYPSSDAASYQLQVAEDMAFTVVVVDTAGLADTSFAVAGLHNLRTYYWRVRAANAAGTGEWSSVWNFETIIGPTETPVMVSPPSGATGVNVNPTLTWRPAVNAASYTVQIAEDAAFTLLVVNMTGISDTTYTAAGLVPLRTYFWHVRATNVADTGTYSATWTFTTHSPGAVELTPGVVPSEFGLDRNYPNPFNPGTRIGFRIPRESWVTLTIYNVRGAEVERLMSERLPAGTYHAWWNASQLPSGMYICRMVAGSFTSAQRILLVK